MVAGRIFAAVDVLPMAFRLEGAFFQGVAVKIHIVARNGTIRAVTASAVANHAKNDR
jgi:hypothetical protein